MPIYEYRCRGCNREFEELVLPKSTPHCPSCESEDLERLLSLFGVSSEGIRRSRLSAERKKQSKVRKDKEIADHEHMHEHMH
jgi:putative FmdB family regulatory protein